MATLAKQHRSDADKLRAAGKATDDILSGLVGKLGTALKVKSGRLILDTKRGETCFADLSPGERWKIALDIAIEQVGAGGVLPIPQEAWESLDPTNRRMLAEHVAGKHVTFITAESERRKNYGPSCSPISIRKRTANARAEMLLADK